MKTVGILTSGGDAQGMNTCIYYLTKRLLDEGYKVYGIHYGFKGLIEKDYELLDYSAIANIENRGGTYLGTARLDGFRKKELQDQAYEFLKERNIGTLICLGGNGTFKGAEALSKYGINVMCIPCTIDNDLYYSDFSIGYKTAVQICLTNIESLKDTMGSHDRVSIVVTMGRDKGYIALESGLVSGCKFIIIPERKYDVKQIAKIIKEDNENGIKSDMICVAEGCMENNDISSFQEEISKELGEKIRANTLGHIQRGGTPVAADKLLAIRFSEKVIDNIIKKKKNKVVGLRNNKIVSFGLDCIDKYDKHQNTYYDELMAMAFDHLK